MNLAILYRGPLSSCNYACGYCPFAKYRETRAELDGDRRALERFLAWVGTRTGDRLEILFTPWGEALVRRWYRDALVRLTRIAHVAKVAAQTNLSCTLGWIDDCDSTKLALWCTYHPDQVTRERFLARCRELDRRGVRFSVGAVGLRENEDELRRLRAELPPHVYFWVNAYKSRLGYYRPGEVERFEAIDPLFRINLRNHPSGGKPCLAGEAVISVDGDGVIRRCHFIREPIGNIYGPGVEAALAPRPCSVSSCRCHIGYVHLEELGLHDLFAGGVLERIPAGWGDARQVSTRGL
jgi:MoaA/NifB/PqqE/SkfB family radical SAM enzyme